MWKFQRWNSSTGKCCFREGVLPLTEPPGQAVEGSALSPCVSPERHPLMAHLGGTCTGLIWMERKLQTSPLVFSTAVPRPLPHRVSALGS